MVEVYFVDFGNTDKVDAIDVLALPAEFGGLETQVRFYCFHSPLIFLSFFYLLNFGCYSFVF